MSTILVLIGLNVVVLTPFRYLDAHSWRLTRFPAPTNIVVQCFDVTVGTPLAGLSEEVVFRFYLINLFLLRRRSLPMAVLLSTLIFAAIHWSYGLGITIFAALAGLMFAGLYIAKGNLALPLIAHAGFDAVVFVGGVGALGRIYNQA